MKRLAILVMAFALAGCAGAGSIIETTFDKDGKALKTTEHRSDYASYTKAIEPPKERPKLMDIECPATGCNFTKFVVYDPGSGGGHAAPAAPPEDFATTVVRESFATLRGAIPYAAGVSVLNTAFKKANSSVSTSTSTVDSHNSSSTTTSTSTTTTASGNGAAAANGGSATGSAPSTSTTTTTTSSNNPTTTTTTPGP